MGSEKKKTREKETSSEATKKDVKIQQNAIHSADEADHQSEFRIQVTAARVNVRIGPGTSYGISTQIKDRGIYTIIDRIENWGKLKSGAGWICLDFTKKV